MEQEDIQAPLSLQGVVCSEPILIIMDTFLVRSTPSRLPEKKTKRVALDVRFGQEMELCEGLIGQARGYREEMLG